MENLKGKKVLAKADIFDNAPEEERIILCTGGFGCDADSIGRKIFGKTIFSNKDICITRSNIERVATEEDIHNQKEYMKIHKPTDPLRFEEIERRFRVVEETQLNILETLKKKRISDDEKFTMRQNLLFAMDRTRFLINDLLSRGFKNENE